MRLFEPFSDLDDSRVRVGPLAHVPGEDDGRGGAPITDALEPATAAISMLSVRAFEKTTKAPPWYREKGRTSLEE